MIEYRRATSRTVFATGPTWSRLDANATTVSRNGPVRRPEAYVPAQCGWLLIEPPVSDPSPTARDRPRRPQRSRRTRPARATDPTDSASDRRRSSRSTSPSRTRPCSLAFGEGLEAVHRDRGEVDEDVVPTLALDEAVALLVRKPLDGALLHYLSSYSVAGSGLDDRRRWSQRRNASA